MRRTKQKMLAEAGWIVGSVKDFLKLTPAEAAYFELKLRLSLQLREQRRSSGLTQAELARQIGSSQSRIAKAEANDPSVSVDLLVRALFAMGITPKGLAKLITRQPPGKAA